MAKNYKKSNYGINKNRKGIVYQYADGSSFEITLEKISATDPNFTQEDFDKLKEFSDELYHNEEKGDCLYGKWVKTALDDNKDSDWLATEALEDEIFDKLNEKEIFDKIYDVIYNNLTETQKRRMMLFAFKGLSTREIAVIEGTSQKSVWESINTAQNKIKKVLKIF